MQALGLGSHGRKAEGVVAGGLLDLFSGGKKAEKQWKDHGKTMENHGKTMVFPCFCLGKTKVLPKKTY